MPYCQMDLPWNENAITYATGLLLLLVIAALVWLTQSINASCKTIQQLNILQSITTAHIHRHEYMPLPNYANEMYQRKVFIEKKIY
ncbi:hypothetical protein M514_05377 [Trichuris suis]|uniref:Uncharacterized protein n=1 Tax=Trichuris suis TaxID=68888 RepID=A0A085M8X6_9BILA|nr:hypothetical protein M513_05377 [Trichuris suis]KFD60671.1 hypothetical protein M514_05377 [Trichuris suis]